MYKKNMLKKRIAILLAAVLGAGIMLSACGNAPENTETPETEEAAPADEAAEPEDAENEESEPEEAVDYLQDIAYIDDENKDHLLDIFGSEDVTEKTKTIVEIHGGGLIGGSKETNTDHSKYYEENGFIVVTPNYTHVRAGEATLKETIQDLFAAYNWVGEHADEYHIDLDHIFLSGDSAGGLLLLLTAATLHSEEMQQFFEVQKPSYDFLGYAATCPETDLLSLRDKLDAEGSEGYTANAIGADTLNDEELMAHADLYSIIDPATFPYIYMLTTPEDDTTGEETLKFDQFLTDNNIAHELHSYENQENELLHVFNIIHTDWVESIQANDDIIAYLNSLIE